MKVAIIAFSPSGNTLKVSRLLEKSLLAQNCKVQRVNLARDKELFDGRNIRQYLKKIIKEHDLLCVGSPVYAHHMHYNVQNIIKALPHPKNGWGKLAVPFVTYGGINSGIALQEGAKLLKKSGRTIVAGMKVNSSHCLSKLKQIKRKVNEGMPGDEALTLIEDLACRIKELEGVNLEDCVDITHELGYQSRDVKIKAHIIFREKLWHRHMYPKPIIDSDKCERCGKCVKLCPVQRIELNGKEPFIPKGKPECIHCASCVRYCPTGAMYFDADWAKWNKLLSKAADGFGPMVSNEKPKSAVYPLTESGYEMDRRN